MKIIFINLFLLNIYSFSFNGFKKYLKELENKEKVDIKKTQLDFTINKYNSSNYNNNLHIKEFKSNKEYFNNMIDAYNYDKIQSLSSEIEGQSINHLGKVHKGGLKKLQSQALGRLLNKNKINSPQDDRNVANSIFDNYLNNKNTPINLLTAMDENINSNIECFKPGNGYGHPFCKNDKIIEEHFDLHNFKGPYKVNAHLESESKVKKRKDEKLKNSSINKNELYRKTQGIPQDTLNNFKIGNALRASGEFNKNFEDKLKRYVTPEDEFHYS